ncbi:DnaB-like helicase C-terminal domain-containing protein [Sphingomonas sp. RT2P30]|uniref:replicative DNA helicase n=1 Tax=Parasphingomonas halimpatiens TaxID=3096162 RepID=UPI002FCB5904
MNGFDGHVAELHDQPSSLRNFDAEIGLLGDLLANNQLIDPAADLCRPLDFSVPLHGKVFGQMVIEIAAGRKVDAITLAPYFQDDPDWSRTYSILAAASLNAGTRARTKALLQQVTILSSRRRLVAGLQDVIHAARDLTIEPAQLISDADEVVAEIAGGDDEVTQAPVGDYAQLVIDSFGKPVIGVRSGVIGSLDDLMGVLRPTNFVVTGGRPGMGKTLAVTNYARGAAERGHGVMLFSLEMSADELTRRILAEMCHSIEGGILYEHVRDGTVSANEIERVRQAKERLDALPFEICDRSGLTLASLVRRVRSHKRRLAARNQKLELVIVDYLQLMAPSRPGMSMYEHASEVSRGLKVLAKDEDLVVMAVAQLNRDVEKRPDKRPIPADLRDSGQIEQDADIILFVYREEEYLKLQQPDDPHSADYAKWDTDMRAVKNKIEFIMPKRRSGRTGKALGWFFGDYAAIRGADFYRSGGGEYHG